MYLRGCAFSAWRLFICVIGLGSVFLLYHKFAVSTGQPPSTLEAQIFNATLGFQKILVLNLPSRTDHADSMKLGAAVSDLHINFVNGVDGSKVLDKVLPYPPPRNLGDGNIGSWRAHMDAVAHIVANNISTALIMEDDIDWDIRIKKQMRDFSRGTRALSQPLHSLPNQYGDPTFLIPRPNSAQPKHELLSDEEHFDFSETSMPPTELPLFSPYGDDWDVLWLGHCAMRFPRAQDHVPKGRYLILNDDTMIKKPDIATGDPEVFPQNYPNFTRVIHHAWDPLCTFAYAVSQRGARKILWEFGIQRFDLAFDNMMVDFCDINVCLTIQPQLFSGYAAPGPVNRDSDINGFGQDLSDVIREKGKSDNIQLSVRLNMQAILNGTPVSQLKNQYPL